MLSCRMMWTPCCSGQLVSCESWSTKSSRLQTDHGSPSEKLSQNVGSSSAPGTKNHIYQVYRSDAIQRHFQSLGGDLESAVDCTDGMILIAMLSGGDYLPAGVKDCGMLFTLWSRAN